MNLPIVKIFNELMFICCDAFPNQQQHVLELWKKFDLRTYLTFIAVLKTSCSSSLLMMCERRG